MAPKQLVAVGLSAFSILGAVQAQGTACEKPIAPQNAAPSVALGFRVEVVANGLRDPRSILFDRQGGLLVVEQGYGVSRLSLTGDGACVRVEGPVQNVIENDSLNHGIAFSEDGNTLYASSHSNVFAWDYDASQGKTTSDSRDVVQGMGDKEGHTTRTLLMSQKVPGMLLVSRGSVGNIDLQTLDVTTGVSTIKAYNVNNVTSSAYDHASTGRLLGWGLRNSVGIAEDPVTGGIYSVENSVDNIMRSEQLIKENNPGEEMNFHGSLNETAGNIQDTNHGYPSCFTAWNTSEIPDFNGQVGQQFAIGDQNATVNDTFCQNDRVAPRLAFQAHMAPLDIKFNPNGTAAWVTMHGSWNREDPAGYKLTLVPFNGAGSPVAPSNSTTAAIDVVSNPDLSACPRSCFRPVGLAWDAKGRLYMSSDSTGEIFVVTREDGSGVADVSATASASSGQSPVPNASGGLMDRWSLGSGVYWVVVAIVMSVLV
ncbi:hypothetical protein COCC4DRAFT_161655 [Bipolaris maydis ATCC 48331]|uniref:Pyrroloquinoline quinone-dependent pyranose dehydrogenase beta-propeller domain-containing protein n=2 Tax=Cochliobolus heterostrophus TaxID=5016 RepID=M2UCI3_COCH5|nr:uncharacterized protein COCC4DRAFT_161655 [Bipolaris maydis ATCC 48331]EMD91386.1 hypothetical protein COCHEDRAFT_1135855 [Bipolaris maydis C5]KAJ5058802.1 soluble quino protein glucose/sorbosone dehydrogenase [Bipolaris maydis]ENI08854.1 hypothetical protein COCC4DRAFT_161655 [Bipolaris maydis ATCC 48331]KAJ6202398.1 soluble quino protein glucose/sorbosone dehydrogenase [Bipolaris maydis]KAJ6208787.1 soluble quino protein glucose/sorbosone dehydrogenase [Bipolaris maydis]